MDYEKEDEWHAGYQASVKAIEALRDVRHFHGAPSTKVTKAGDYKITVTVERYVVPK